MHVRAYAIDKSFSLARLDPATKGLSTLRVRMHFAVVGRYFAIGSIIPACSSMYAETSLQGIESAI